MSTISTTAATARGLYSAFEDDLITAMSMALFLSRALDSMPDLDKDEAEGAGRVARAIYDRLDGIKGEMLNAVGPS
jgi:hypothetical protein